MDRLGTAVVGLGRLGRRCAELVRDSAELELCGLCRHGETVDAPLPETLRRFPVAAHVSELRRVQAALVCVPTEHALSTITELLQHRIPLVECASLDGHALDAHYAAIDRLAGSHGVPAIVGAGWNPGMRQQLERLFEILIPKGRTELTDSPGLSLHHTAIARDIPGVRAALAAEFPGPEGRRQHYFYVELAPDRDPVEVRQALAADPLLAGEEIIVFPVESVADLEQRGHGVLLERLGTVGAEAHETLLLEGRFDVHTLTARLMLAAAPRLRDLPRGAHRFPVFGTG